MNITQLHTTCKKVTREQFESFKNQIQNPVFPLDDNIIAIEIQDMRQSIGQKVLGDFMSNNLTKPQRKVLEAVLKRYEDLAERVALNFVKNHCK